MSTATFGILRRTVLYANEFCQLRVINDTGQMPASVARSCMCWIKHFCGHKALFCPFFRVLRVDWQISPSHLSKPFPIIHQLGIAPGTPIRAQLSILIRLKALTNKTKQSPKTHAESITGLSSLFGVNAGQIVSFLGQFFIVFGARIL